MNYIRGQAGLLAVPPVNTSSFHVNRQILIVSLVWQGKLLIATFSHLLTLSANENDNHALLADKTFPKNNKEIILLIILNTFI